MVLLFGSVDGFVTVLHAKFHMPNSSNTSATMLLDLKFRGKKTEAYLNFLKLKM
jgi:glycerol kinase